MTLTSAWPIQRFPQLPQTEFDNSLKWLAKLKTVFYLWRRFYYKGYNRNSQMVERHRAKEEARGESGTFIPFQGTLLTEHSEFTNLEVLRISLFQSLYNSISSPLSHLQEFESWGWIFPPSNCVWSFRWSAPILQLAGDSTLSHLISINSGVFKGTHYE